MRGGYLLKHWSSIQQTIALSSGETELKGIVKGAAEGLGLQSVGKDLNMYIPTPVPPWEWLLEKA